MATAPIRQVSSPPSGFPDRRSASSAWTVDDALDHMGLGRFQAFAIAIGGLAYAADAMEMMILSFLGPLLRCEFKISPEQEAVLTTMVFVGMCAGGYFLGILSDRFGRRVGMLTTAVVCSVAGTLTAVMPSFGGLVAMRTLVGVGVGGVAIAYGWVLEMVPSASRGKVGGFVQAFWTVGTLLQAGLAWATLDTLGWRWLVGLTATPLFIMLVLFFFAPESPRFLLATNQVGACVNRFSPDPPLCARAVFM